LLVTFIIVPSALPFWIHKYKTSLLRSRPTLCSLWGHWR